MNARARGRKTADDATRGGEIVRIQQLWAECRSRFGTSGPWLFGEYSVADAMFAPVVLRFSTYGPQLDESAASYVATTLADPHMREWIDAASAETWTIEASEIGRPGRVN